MSYYSPTFGNVHSGWYRVTTDPNYCDDRNAIDLIWTRDCDDILISYVKKHGSFYTAHSESIKKDIEATINKSFKKFRYYEYYFQNRVFELGLGDFLIDYYKEIKDKTFTCQCCDKEEHYVYVHPNAIKRIFPPKFCTRCFYLVFPYLAEWDSKIQSMAQFLLKNINEKRKCDLCNKQYKLDITDFSVQNMMVPAAHLNIFSSICPKCINKIFMRIDDESEDKTEQYKLLYQLYQLVGEIPTQDYYSLLYIFKDRNSIIDICKIFMKLWSPQTFKKVDGSFFASLVYSGILPEGTKKMKIGTMVLADDGHVCLSMVEKDIDDFLYRNDIEHKKEIKYPESDYRCDWEIYFNDSRYFIEYFGLMNNPEYAKKANIKKQIAIDNGIVLIELFPDSDWKVLLSKIFLDK